MDTDLQRQQRAWGRIGGLTAHSRHSPDEMLANARRAFMAKWERQVDAAGDLPADERARRAERALRAHMLTLALLSAAVRKARRAG